MATPYYVSKAGNDSWDGLSWVTAKLTIQAGINLATSGDTVWVRDGTYVENITVGAGIIVRSETGLPADVAIDGGGVGRVATMADTSSWLIGFTVTNGSVAGSGGGINYGSALNCILTNNAATSYGGGAYECHLINCVLSENTAGIYGGGISGNSTTSNSCLFTDHTSLFAFGFGAMYNCTITRNSGGMQGGTINNCIFWGNSGGCNTNINYSCGEGFTGVYNIASDPLFVSSTDFRLQPSSPCINIGNNAYVTAGDKDLDSNERIWPTDGIVDMGAYEYGSEPGPQSTSSSSISSSSLSSLSSSSLSSLSSSSQSSLSSSSLSSLSSPSSLSSLSSQSSLSSSSKSSLSSISSLSSSSPSSQSSVSSSSHSSSSSSSVSEIPNPTTYIYKDWIISSRDHLSNNVNYQTSIYDNIELNYPLINNNTIDQRYCFSYDQTGTSKHFRGFPAGGLNRPPADAIVRYQLNKNRLRRFFVSKNNNLHQISFDSKIIVKTYNFNELNIKNISLNDINGDIWAFADNFAYCINNADFNSKTRSLQLSEDTLFVKIDGIRNSIWQIEKRKIVLKDYYGTELFNSNLPMEINSVIDCLIMQNTGEIFILAQSGLSTSGTILISYIKNRVGLSDLLYIDSYIEGIGDWGIHNVLAVSGDQFVKKYEDGVLTTLFDLSSYGINCNCVSSLANNNIYVLDRSGLLNKINYSTGELIWNISVPSVTRPETMKIFGNFEGDCIWVGSYDSCCVILDNGDSAHLENNLYVAGIGSMWDCLEKQLVLPHIWMKCENK